MKKGVRGENTHALGHPQHLFLSSLLVPFSREAMCLEKKIMFLADKRLWLADAFDDLCEKWEHKLLVLRLLPDFLGSVREISLPSPQLFDQAGFLCF